MENKIAIIGGSNAYSLLKKGALGKPIESKKHSTPFGKSGTLFQFMLDGIPFLFLSRHGDTGYAVSAPFVNYRANIWALKEAGVDRIISWSGPGIINKSFCIGDYVIPDDFIDETRNRNYTFFEGKGIGFIRQSTPFCPEVRCTLKESTKQTGIKCHDSGVYLCTQGPRLETPAEIKKYKLIGGDMVGMTLIPEVHLARELEICYGSLCYLTNFAEGISDRSYEKGVLFEGMQTEDEKEKTDRAVLQFTTIIKTAIPLLSAKKHSCACKDAMLRYKRRGDITSDWRTWID